MAGFGPPAHPPIALKALLHSLFVPRGRSAGPLTRQPCARRASCLQRLRDERRQTEQARLPAVPLPPDNP